MPATYFPRSYAAAPPGHCGAYPPDPLPPLNHCRRFCFLVEVSRMWRAQRGKSDHFFTSNSLIVKIFGSCYYCCKPISLQQVELLKL